MTPAEANASPFNPFDVTKTWPHAQFPLITVGRILLNKNPGNYFAEVEQLAFSPSHFIPGIAASPDRNLQGRLFAYDDAHKYRLGVNNQQIPVNCPYRVSNFSRGGFATIDNQGGAPIYHPNSFGGPEASRRAKALAPAFSLVGEARRYDDGDDDNYTQPGVFYRRVMDAQAKQTLVDNFVNDIRRANSVIQNRMIEVLTSVDEDLGRRVREGVQKRTADL